MTPTNQNPQPSRKIPTIPMINRSDLEDIITSLHFVQEQTGFGSVTIVIRNGILDLIDMTITRRTKFIM